MPSLDHIQCLTSLLGLQEDLDTNPWSTIGFADPLTSADILACPCSSKSSIWSSLFSIPAKGQCVGAIRRVVREKNESYRIRVDASVSSCISRDSRSQIDSTDPLGCKIAWPTWPLRSCEYVRRWSDLHELISYLAEIRWCLRDWLLLQPTFQGWTDHCT